MANIALIIAGGSGSRMHQDIPKQFLTVNERPIVIYTLEIFEKHPEIDSIAAVCLKGWENVLQAYAKQFSINKLKYIISGGATGHESIRNGVFELEKHFSPDDIVVIHAANRPLVEDWVISECIHTASEKGCAVTSLPCIEVMLGTDDGITAAKEYSRSNLRRTQTPQAFRIKDICALHRQAIKLGIKDSPTSCTLMLELGGHVYFSSGSEKNIKITTVEDIDIFRALLAAGRSEMLKNYPDEKITPPA